MGAFIDLTGQKYNRLTAVKCVGRRNTRAIWLCKCDCGKEVVVDSSSLRTGNTKSCGCLNSEIRSKRMIELHTKHGESRTRLYGIWAGMLRRCDWENPYYYSNYGGRGITVCDEWKNYETFREWALSHGYSDELTIDRIDVDGNYCPENCRWITRTEQASNKRTNKFIEYNGQKKTVAQWAKDVGILPCTLQWRINNGWSAERALETKPRHLEAVES